MSSTLHCRIEQRFDMRNGYIFDERVIAHCTLCGEQDASPWLGAGAFDLIIGPPEYRALVKRHDRCRERVRGNLSLLEPNPLGTLSVVVEEGALSHVE